MYGHLMCASLNMESVNLADVLTILFLLAFLADRLITADRRLPRTAAVVVVFLAA